MRRAVDLLSQYAGYHRDERNILSHFVGVPLIVFALGLLLARPSFEAGGVAVAPASVVVALSAAWYLTRGDLFLGAVVSVIFGSLMLLGQRLAGGSTATALAWGAAVFAIGWLIQFAGHWYEGKKPAFVDDLIGLLVGPMFITAEVLFALGWNRPLLEQIEQRVGPTMLRDLAKIA